MFPRRMWHLCDDRDGRGRPYCIVRRLLVVERCQQLPGCYVTSDGKHVQHVFDRYEDLPPPRFRSYHFREEERPPPGNSVV